MGNGSHTERGTYQNMPYLFGTCSLNHRMTSKKRSAATGRLWLHGTCIKCRQKLLLLRLIRNDTVMEVGWRGRRRRRRGRRRLKRNRKRNAATHQYISLRRGRVWDHCVLHTFSNSCARPRSIVATHEHFWGRIGLERTGGQWRWWSAEFVHLFR